MAQGSQAKMEDRPAVIGIPPTVDIQALRPRIITRLASRGLPIRIHEADPDEQGRVVLVFDISPPNTPSQEKHARLRTLITHIREELQGKIVSLILRPWEKRRKT